MRNSKPAFGPISARIADRLDLLEPGKDWRTDETLLLLALLDLAMTNITISRTNREEPAATACLTRAIDTYGQVKDLLPKLDLEKEQIALIREGLDLIRQHLWPGPLK